MSQWVSVNKYGIVVDSFNSKQYQQHQHLLDLNVGDLVYIKAERDGWCKGSVFRNRYILKYKNSLLGYSTLDNNSSSSSNTSASTTSTENDGANLNNDQDDQQSRTSNNAQLNAGSTEGIKTALDFNVSGMNTFPIAKGFFPSGCIKRIEEKSDKQSILPGGSSTGTTSSGLSSGSLVGGSSLIGVGGGIGSGIGGGGIGIGGGIGGGGGSLTSGNSGNSQNNYLQGLTNDKNRGGDKTLVDSTPLAGIISRAGKANNLTFIDEIDSREFEESKYGFFEEKDFEVEHCFDLIQVTEEWLAFFDGSRERMEIVDRDQFDRIYEILTRIFFDIKEYARHCDLLKVMKEKGGSDGIAKIESKLLKFQNNDIKLVEEGCNVLLYDIIIRKKGKILDDLMQMDQFVTNNNLDSSQQSKQQTTSTTTQTKSATSTTTLTNVNSTNNSQEVSSTKTLKSRLSFTLVEQVRKVVDAKTGGFSSTLLSTSSTVTTIVKVFRNYVQTCERELEALQERRQKRVKNHAKKETTVSGKMGGALGRLGFPFHLNDVLDDTTHTASGDDSKQFYHLPDGNTQLMVALENCVIDSEHRFELEISLYSKKAEQIISENFILQMSSASEKNLNPSSKTNLERRCIIKDITSSDIKEDLYFVFRLYRVGPVLIDEKNKKATASADVGDVKRPFGVAIADINPNVINNIVTGENVNLPKISAFATTKEENFYSLHQLLIKLTNEHGGQIPSDLPKDVSKIQEIKDLTISLGMLIGDYEQQVFSKENLKSRPVIQMLRFPSAVSPGDRRNDIYITLEGLASSVKELKNVLVEAELYQVPQSISIKNPPIHSETRPMIPLSTNPNEFNSGNLPSSLPQEKRKLFTSTVLYHIKNPKWKETFRVSVEPDLIDRSIVVFKLFNCRSRHATKELVGFAYWKMTNSSGLLDVTCKSEQDSSSSSSSDKQSAVEISVYKVTKKFKGGDFAGIFDFHKNPEERETHRTKGQKLNISFNVVSTRITQNPEMKNLLDWKLQRSVSDVVNQFTFNMGDVMGIAIFIREIFGALFDILSANEDQAGVPEKIFEVTYKAINNILSQKQFWPFLRVIDEYITNYFQSVNAYKWLLKFLIRDLAKIQAIKSEDELLREDPYDKIMPFELENQQFDDFNDNTTNNTTGNTGNNTNNNNTTGNTTTTGNTPPPVPPRKVDDSQQQQQQQLVPSASLAKIVPVLSQSIKCIDYWAKFIVKSRENYTERFGLNDKDESEFEKQVSVLMKQITILLQHPQKEMLGVKANCLKFLSSSFFDEMNRVFKDDKKLGRAVVDFILAMNNCSAAVDTGKTDTKKTKEQKSYSNRILAMSCVLKSNVFKRDGCRKVLLPFIIDVIRDGIIENNGGDIESGVILLNDLLHATQKLMVQSNRKQSLLYQSLHTNNSNNSNNSNNNNNNSGGNNNNGIGNTKNNSQLLASFSENTNSQDYSFQKKRRQHFTWISQQEPQEGENYSDGLVKTIYEIFQLFQTVKDRYESLTSDVQSLRKDIDDKRRLLAETQNEVDQSKQNLRRGGNNATSNNSSSAGNSSGGVTTQRATNINQANTQKEIDENEKKLLPLENIRRELMCSIISFVKMYSGSSILLLSHLINDEKVATGLAQQSLRNLMYLHELITSKTNSIPREWIGFRSFQLNTLFRSLISISNVMIHHFTIEKDSLTSIVQSNFIDNVDFINSNTNSNTNISTNNSNNNSNTSNNGNNNNNNTSNNNNNNNNNIIGGGEEQTPIEYKELWDMLFKHFFGFINYMDLENNRAFERVIMLSKHEDYRYMLLKHIYDNIYNHSNMRKDIKLIFVPKLVHQIMTLFNIDNRLLHGPAIKLYYALLETEFENHKRLAQCEAVTQSRLVRSKIGRLFKQSFTDCLKSMFEKDINNTNNNTNTNNTNTTNNNTTNTNTNQQQQLGKEGLLLLNRLETLISQVEQIQTFEDKDEHKFCEACIDVMRSFKINHNYDLYYQYVDKLSAVHERYGNYIEAALVLYKHAKRLQWNDERKLPYHSDEYPEQSEADRKIKLYEKMIDLFDKGKDWERAIELSRQLRNYYLHNYKYAKTQNLLKREGEFYNLIMTKRRFFASYYYVNFMGRGFLKMGLQGPYIYKSVEGENFMDFLNGLKDKYQAQLFQKTPTDPEQYREQEGRFFVAYHVDQSSEFEWENIFQHRDKRISPKILCYRKLHNINHFKSESRYRESKEKTNNEYKDMHREITFFITPKKFPTICRRQRILCGDSLKIYQDKLSLNEKLKYRDYSQCIDLSNISYIANDKLLHLCPLENATKDIEDKVNELEELVINHHLDQQPDTNALSMSLNGTIDAAVNGGQEKYISAFFTEQYVSTHPEHDLLLKRFKIALQNQIFILEEGLRQRRLFVEGKAVALNEYLETRLQEMKKKLEELLFK
ncbi:dedicator of cytokinesis 5 [Naegleria gruberi]|uniref:Dedicator of cytokinesis 5 n=1 Tax=Naegleria gruberi TaxID=5762 RepID=D2V6R0_NAEGR|nr:dedicator of cytokinesis 5 [Naegleria gruberi]EFC47483.1 dedicator of cytokinesis 5 [Naegleria gruberi]|eukprot:XP_002680227.1 dedicator of cytokinesis 5 [Naegleria gruberi strain NEG-M]